MVVLITGASKGIGAKTAILFAEKGYDVVINYNRDFEGAKNIKDEIEKFNIRSLIVQADVSNEMEVSMMIDKIYATFGSIDCVINNASISNDTKLFDKTKEDFRKIIDVNLIGTYLVCKYASKYMEKGTIINIASNNALNCYYPYSADYDASKAGVISLTHNLAIELSPNIRVNAVAPGWVNTDMNKDMDETFCKQECDKILLKRFAEAEEVAKVIYFLASSDASYINNSVIRVDGGTNGSY